MARLQTRSLNRVLAIHQTGHVGCVQMDVTIALVAKNMCMSRHWKYDHVGFITHVQTRQVSCFLWPKNLTKHMYVQSVQIVISTVT
jgi:hypothetical protein